jgi:hypothetical protein
VGGFPRRHTLPADAIERAARMIATRVGAKAP